MKKKPHDDNLIAENRRARHNYTIDETYECGIALLGSEVKSIRDRHLSFADAYALIKNGEVFIIGLRIEKYKQATHDHIDTERTRKLLLNKKEIKRIERALSNKSTTLVPLKIYFKNGKVKVLIGLGTGKSKIDKRQSIKERDIKKELSRVLKRG
ncbi:MAG: SsrA-binding protein SmpB [Myxococcales bacterium]|nr:SsrA-binding protein SmpB [Myxococcales bacterium]USN51108.1 MAG: SsrA-binding protein SmpB [Myxococcales bacterium]